MKIYQALLPLAAAMMIAGCGNRGTAESVIGQADGALTMLRRKKPRSKHRPNSRPPKTRSRT